MSYDPYNRILQLKADNLDLRQEIERLISNSGPPIGLISSTQEIRAFAANIAANLVETALSTDRITNEGMQDSTITQGLIDLIIRVAQSIATWIEHGPQDQR